MSPRPFGRFDQDTRYRKRELLGEPLAVLSQIVP